MKLEYSGDSESEPREEIQALKEQAWEILRRARKMEKESGSPPAGLIPSAWKGASAANLLSKVTFDEDEYIATSGSGPWNESELDDFLNGLGLETDYAIQEDVSIIVVGHEVEDINVIHEYIFNASVDVSIYPQELFLSYLFTGVDPLPLLSYEQIDAWLDFHPVLRELRDTSEDFPWPSDKGVGLDEETVIVLKLKNSPLSLMGYRTGRNGRDADERHAILANAYQGEIPKVIDDEINTADYMRQWGRPNTARRLWRIAKHLSAQITIHQKNDAFQFAVDDWRNDLQWLSDNFGGGGGNFTWPR